ncbi:MAG TPA: hypothetical protein VIU86_20120 [Gaiellaceae bacterium]
MKLPWQPLDPDGDGILARIVHDASTEHVAVFESAGAARAACDAVNRAEGRESELREMTGELERVRTKLARSLDLWREWTTTDITEDDDTWAEFTDRVHALLEEA